MYHLSFEATGNRREAREENPGWELVMGGGLVEAVMDHSPRSPTCFRGEMKDARQDAAYTRERMLIVYECCMRGSMWGLMRQTMAA